MVKPKNSNPSRNYLAFIDLWLSATGKKIKTIWTLHFRTWISMPTSCPSMVPLKQRAGASMHSNSLFSPRKPKLRCKYRKKSLLDRAHTTVLWSCLWCLEIWTCRCMLYLFVNQGQRPPLTLMTQYEHYNPYKKESFSWKRINNTWPSDGAKMQKMELIPIINNKAR